MNFINELIYSKQVAQTKKLAKDKKQKNQYRQIALMSDHQDDEKSSHADINELANNETTELAVVINEEDERRHGGDRRKAQQDRGRYIESRQQKNRRYHGELSLKI